MGKIKVGDTVIVLNTRRDDHAIGVIKGERYKVVETGMQGRVYIKAPKHSSYLMFADQVEKVEDRTEYTFAEMVHRMTNGDFEHNSVLKRDGRVLYVRETVIGYGLSNCNDAIVMVDVPISANDINATWTVEQPESSFEEMTIEEIQERLGHKIKIVEQPTR